jgi:peptidoglycan hydrolase-like protein with peptidoglycan-binding domain
LRGALAVYVPLLLNRRFYSMKARIRKTSYLHHAPYLFPIPAFFAIALAITANVTLAQVPVQIVGQNAAVACPALTTDLRLGVRNPQVAQLQAYLIGQGLLEMGLATGYFGPATRTAVQRFQAIQNIASAGDEASTGFGYVGARTRKVIGLRCGGSPAAFTPPASVAATSVASSSCPVLKTPSCASGTLAYMGKDKAGCSLGYQCAPFKFPATTTPVIFLPSESSVAPSEYLATSTIIFTRFPNGSTTDRGQFVLGERSSAYLELDPQRLCVRVLSKIEGTKEACAPVSLDVVYRIEFSVLADKVKLFLNDVNVASLLVHPNAPKTAFRAGSRAPDPDGHSGPLIGSLQSVSIVETSSAKPAVSPVPGSVRCPALTQLPSCFGTVVSIGTDGNGCNLGYYCKPPK